MAIKGKRRWLAAGGYDCPYCGSDDIGTHFSETCCDTVHRECEMECYSCDGRWKVECKPIKVTETLVPKTDSSGPASEYRPSGSPPVD